MARKTSDESISVSDGKFQGRVKYIRWREYFHRVLIQPHPVRSCHTLFAHATPPMSLEPRYKDPHKDNRAFKDIFQGPIFFVCKIRIISNIRISLIFWVPNHSILKFMWLILYFGTQKLQVLYSKHGPPKPVAGTLVK